jgi:hypothetical protein
VAQYEGVQDLAAGQKALQDFLGLDNSSLYALGIYQWNRLVFAATVSKV